MTLIKYITALILGLLTMASCSNDKSLQRYLVDKQEDDRYLKVDLATSLLQAENNTFTEEEKDILNTVKKVNVVAYPLKGANAEEYQSEKAHVEAILDQDKYKTLMSTNSNDFNITLSYLGEETAIDEVIVFATSQEKGFGVFRLLCDDMRPDQIMKLTNSIQKGNLDVSKLSGIGDIFEEM
ncbi:MAG: DUF4252 domain-containing protein [Bacteroidota bacterium]